MFNILDPKILFLLNKTSFTPLFSTFVSLHVLQQSLPNIFVHFKWSQLNEIILASLTFPEGKYNIYLSDICRNINKINGFLPHITVICGIPPLDWLNPIKQLLSLIYDATTTWHIITHNNTCLPKCLWSKTGQKKRVYLKCYLLRWSDKDLQNFLRHS